MLWYAPKRCPMQDTILLFTNQWKRISESFGKHIGLCLDWVTGGWTDGLWSRCCHQSAYLGVWLYVRIAIFKQTNIQHSTAVDSHRISSIKLSLDSLNIKLWLSWRHSTSLSSVSPDSSKQIDLWRFLLPKDNATRLSIRVGALVFAYQAPTCSHFVTGPSQRCELFVRFTTFPISFYKRQPALLLCLSNRCLTK